MGRTGTSLKYHNVFQMFNGALAADSRLSGHPEHDELWFRVFVVRLNMEKHVLARYCQRIRVG